MDAFDFVTRLAALTRVPDQKRNWFDWPAIESSLGLRLPDDYKQLVEAFPDGFFPGVLRVNRPGDHHESTKEFLGFYAWQLEDMRGLRAAGHPFPYPIFPEPGGLLPWATDRRGQPLFWITSTGDPNAWPVVTAAYDFTGWQEFPGTACQFLIEVVEGRFDGGRFGADAATHGPRFQPIQEDLAPTATPGPARSALTHTGRAVDEFFALAAIIGPSPRPDRPVDWDEIRQFMGVPLPSDYRSFIDTYGPGRLGEIKITVPGGPAEYDLYQLLRRAIEVARDPGTIRSVPICPEPDGIIAWGETDDGWTFSWAPLDSDVDRWSIVAYTRHSLVHFSNLSFSQFMCRYAEGAPDITDFLGRNPALVAPVRFARAADG